MGLHIYKIGVVRRVIYDNYLNDVECKVCYQTTENKLFITCMAFVFGSWFLPFAWFAWGKKGYLECQHCKTIVSLDSPDGKYSKKVNAIYRSTHLPIRFFIPTIVFGSITIIYLLSAGTSFLREKFTSTENKVIGKWETIEDEKEVYVFENHQFAFISPDTIILGHYGVNNHSRKFSISFGNISNTIAKVNRDSLRLNLPHGDMRTFYKSIGREKGVNPYLSKYNAWREKAVHAESFEDLKRRVLNYLTFIKMKYEWALINKFSSLQTEKISPVIFASNGFAINRNSLESWREIFYTTTDWQQANKILENGFPTNYQFNDAEKNIFIVNLNEVNAYIKKIRETKSLN